MKVDKYVGDDKHKKYTTTVYIYVYVTYNAVRSTYSSMYISHTEHWTSGIVQ